MVYLDYSNFRKKLKNAQNQGPPILRARKHSKG